MLQGKKEELADLYYRSKTVQYGEFTLSAHRDNPDLEKSPIYLHYPKDGEGTELLPRLYELVGDLFYELVNEQTKPVEFKKIAAVPKGANPLAEKFAEHYDNYPKNLLNFGKDQYDDGRTIYTGPDGDFSEGDKLLIIEDHTSGGRNKKLILQAAEKAGLEVNTILTVVDRQQGGVANMKELNVRLVSIFTLDDLLEFGLDNDHIDQAMVDKVRGYIGRNQF